MNEEPMNPTVNDRQNAHPLAAITEPDVRQRASRLMRKLQMEITDVWSALVDDEVVFLTGNGPRVDTEKFAIRTEAPTVTIRTLDLECFDKTAGGPYRTLRANRLDGQTVRGLKIVRNSHVHSKLTTDPSLHRVVGPVAGGLWRLYVSWPQYDDLPMDIRTGAMSPSAKLQTTYERHVAGRDVIDTLLDALAFFAAADPSIATWDSAAELQGYPLQQLPGPPGEYQRHTPFNPSLRDWSAKLFDYARGQTPEHPREITGAVRADNGSIECYIGTTQRGFAQFKWIETSDQLSRDVDNGARYHVAGTALASGADGPEVDGIALHALPMSQPQPDEAASIRSRLQWQTDDPNLYIQKRKS